MKEKNQSFVCPTWSEFPDIELYMDQVISVLERYLTPFFPEEEKCITPTMINNYVKNKLIPRPTGKKYSRLHIAMLIMIVALKRVCTMEDIRAMLSAEDETAIRAIYELFCKRQMESIGCMLRVSSELPPAMDCAIFSSAYRAGCECLLQKNPDQAEE